ncbi:CRISPR-associated endonuclease Cas2 [Neosynechococcus sphagnicola]|uniref:CRISPR-associated endonuclease Cas2 n=1 Tax=Neosynechococcus sphagnicola TaxID=1501145 RepID=UPI0009E08EF3
MGQWIQYSECECDLSTTQYARLQARLSKLINPDQNSICLFFICSCCQNKVERIGGAMHRDEEGFFV